MKSFAAKLLILAIASASLSGCIIIDRSGSHLTVNR
jgi:hypothetical protein